MTYSELQTQIASYLHRTDLTAQIPTFIGLAESYLFRELNVKSMQLITNLSTTGEYADLPVDFGSLSRLESTVGGLTYTLDYQSQPETSESATVSPGKFSFENGKIRIFGAGTGTNVTLYYTPRIGALSGVNTTNWILANAQDLYLYASALEGAKYLRDNDQAAALAGLVAGTLDNVRKFSERQAMPVTGSMQIKVRR